MLRDKFPALSSGLFATAVIESLGKGIVLQASGLTITENDLQRAIATEEPKIQKELAKDLLFVLEQEAVRQLLVREAKNEAGDQNGQNDESLVEQFLAKKGEGLSVSEEEISAFYQKNKRTMGTAPLKDLQENIQKYLLQEKGQEAVDSYISKLTDSLQFRLNGNWLEEQNRIALDNPVDKARTSGKPTMAEFGATGCIPCDMMQPILDGLRKDYKDKLNVIFVHVGEEQFLGARYSIRSIPVQVFFDGNGREVFRHAGFFAAEEVNKQLLTMGVTK
jgi:thioredoxin 1